MEDWAGQDKYSGSKCSATGVCAGGACCWVLGAGAVLADSHSGPTCQPLCVQGVRREGQWPAQGLHRYPAALPATPGPRARVSDAHAAPHRALLLTRRCVDPLDGTTNFAHSYPSFAVSVGVVRGSTPVAGCVVEFAGGVVGYARHIVVRVSRLQTQASHPDDCAQKSDGP